MKRRKSKASFIILLIIILLILLLCVIVALLSVAKNEVSSSNNINISIESNESTPKKTIQDIIEKHDSEFIKINESIFTEIYANFKYDLYSDNGRSNESFFREIIEEIIDLEHKSFYLIDDEKNLKIFVSYDEKKERYTMIINDIEDYYDNVDGDIYSHLNEVTPPEKSGLLISNPLIADIQRRGMYYSNTVLTDKERQDIGNGYYWYSNQNIIAKLSNGKALNVIFKKGYKEEITTNIYVGTPLKEIENKLGKATYGSVNKGYLAYKSTEVYVYFYEDEVSIYEYRYAENRDFDNYLQEYCDTGDLATLASNLKNNYQSYFEYEYDEELQSLKIVYPQRGLSIDINNNNSLGITIYKNYCITDTVSSLIRNNKITLEANKDLIEVTELARKESM